MLGREMWPLTSATGALADLTVASPFGVACQLSTRLAGSRAAAVSNAYERKLNCWNKLLNEQQLDPSLLSTSFQPLAVTALGAGDERSLRWLKQFSDVCAAALGTDSGSAFAELMARLPVALWRGNSRLLRVLRQAVPDEREPEEQSVSDED